MSSFTEPLAVEAVPGTRLWRTLRPLVYYAGEKGSAEVYTVPRWFYTDFGSIPRIAWGIVGHPADRPAAYVLHDYLYCARTTSRQRADEILREALGVLGHGPIRRSLIYAAVRIGGRVAWESHNHERCGQGSTRSN